MLEKVPHRCPLCLSKYMGGSNQPLEDLSSGRCFYHCGSSISKKGDHHVLLKNCDVHPDKVFIIDCDTYVLIIDSKKGETEKWLIKEIMNVEQAYVK